MILSLCLNQSSNKFSTVVSSKMTISSMKDIETLPRFTDIVLNDVLEFFPLLDAGRVFKYLVDVLPKNGKMYIAGNDCSEICRHLHNGTLDIVMYNNLMFGGRQSIFSMATLKDMFQQVGLNLIMSSFGGIGNVEYYMIGIK